MSKLYLGSLKIYDSDETAAATAAVKTLSTNLATHTSDTSMHIPSGGTKGLILMSNGDGTSSWATTALEDLLSYGIEWDVTQSTPDCTRVGNALLHKSLPIQSGFRGCVVQDGKVNYYLYSEDWKYMEDGTTLSILDGSEGEVEVDTGTAFYIKSEAEGNKRRVRISTVKIDDTWTLVPRVFMGAYRDTVDMTDSSTPKARSVVNTTTQFRGGGNRTDYDAYLSTDIFRTDLGKPRTNLTRATMRTYAHNAGKYLVDYNIYKGVLFWLAVIEYATFNLQKAFNATPDSNGYKQGGLGNGITTMSSWEKYNYYCPIVPNGYGNSLGNHTGVIAVNIPETTGTDGNTIKALTLYLARYRGIENIFGDIWTNVDGIILLNDVTSDDGSGNYAYKNVYIFDNPEECADTITSNARLLAEQEINTDGYIGEFNLGSEAHIIPLSSDGGSTTKKCDYHYHGSSTDTSLRTLLVGGAAYDGSRAGLGSFGSYNGVGVAHWRIGFRSYMLYK